jgi:hypothetical protein
MKIVTKMKHMKRGVEANKAVQTYPISSV